MLNMVVIGSIIFMNVRIYRISSMMSDFESPLSMPADVWLNMYGELV
jgi:hypothetical protein